MATATHSGSHLEVPGPDDMELHSDHGYDFSDGDIELDLDPVSSMHRDDEDMSIKDAASTTGLDVQTVPTDQDDFMVDDDFIYTEGNDLVGGEQASQNDADMAQSPKGSDHDDDLIDYSDDEGDALNAPADQSATSKDNHLDAVSSHAEYNEHAATAADEEPANDSIDHTSEHQIEDDLTSNNNHNVDDSYEEYPDYAENHAEEATEQEPESHDSEHDNDEFEANAEEHAVKGGLGLATSTAAKTSHDHDENGHHNGAQEHDDEDEQEYGEDQHQEHQSDLQPVTVNYAGNELWLFKHHDTEDSGDWLLDDVSLANATMSDLFNGCRLSLGDDVSREHEIGFRFDNLYNMELYEDNTVCVAVTLGRVVELYHKLHSQDGIAEPESFYMTLLFRPRFITLLADVAKYAEQGSGYSGLEAAVAAGETHFSNLDSNTSTDHEATDWENDEQEEGGVDDEHTDDDASPAKAEETTYEEYEEHAEAQEQDGESGEVHVEEDYGQYGLEHHEEDEGFLHQDLTDTVDEAGYSVDPQESVGASDAHASPVKTEEEVRREQAEDDLIEYSDGEDDAVDDEHKATAAHDPSPSSSTVQGDELTGENADATAAQNLNNEHELNFAPEVENVAGFDEQLATGLEDEGSKAYPEYDENFGQDGTFPEYQADGTTNQEYADIDQQLQLDFLNDTEVNNTTEDGNVEGLEATTKDLAGADDFLDLNDTVWDTEDPLVNTQQDEFTFQNDEEDGAGEHSTTAVPGVADAVADSSIHDSPQGLKRSVDEAGHDSEDALDASDAKRPRV